MTRIGIILYLCDPHDLLEKVIDFHVHHEDHRGGAIVQRPVGQIRLRRWKRLLSRHEVRQGLYSRSQVWSAEQRRQRCDRAGKRNGVGSANGVLNASAIDA